MLFWKPRCPFFLLHDTGLVSCASNTVREGDTLLVQERLFPHARIICSSRSLSYKTPHALPQAAHLRFAQAFFPCVVRPIPARFGSARHPLQRPSRQPPAPPLRAWLRPRPQASSRRGLRGGGAAARKSPRQGDPNSSASCASFLPPSVSRWARLRQPGCAALLGPAERWTGRC